MVLLLNGIHILFKVCLFVMMETMFLLYLSTLEMVTHGSYIITMHLTTRSVEGNFRLNSLPFRVTILISLGLLMEISKLHSRRLRSLEGLRYN